MVARFRSIGFNAHVFYRLFTNSGVLIPNTIALDEVQELMESYMDGSIGEHSVFGKAFKTYTLDTNTRKFQIVPNIKSYIGDYSIEDLTAFLAKYGHTFDITSDTPAEIVYIYNKYDFSNIDNLYTACSYKGFSTENDTTASALFTTYFKYYFNNDDS